ncbi:hypothetical protein [Streptomyces bluensis]|uniref:hypothetical protein n=1 Tax=Streptomyces bluensis TaxID=33897 RepID=UPI00332E71B7
MPRITVHRYDHDGNQLEAVGWFDTERAEVVDEADPMTGARFAQLRKRGQSARFVREALYRTHSGRWVHKETAHIGPDGKWVDDENDASPQLSTPRRYRYLTDEEAVAWLSTHGQQQHIDRFFHESPQERGPGRPEIGQPVQVRLGDLLPLVDEWADERGYSRAGAVRRLVQIGLAHDGARE